MSKQNSIVNIHTKLNHYDILIRYDLSIKCEYAQLYMVKS